MNRMLSASGTVVLIWAGFAGAAENSVTHIVNRRGGLGVKTFKRYDDDWPHVEIHIKPDNKTVRFDGSRSWKMSHRNEYDGWVLQIPKEPQEAAEVLKREHYWRGSRAVGRRVDARVRGRYFLRGGGGSDRNGGNGGRAGDNVKPPIWTVLSLDCDIDADSNRDGKVETDNYSKAADAEDAIEDIGGNPFGAVVPVGGYALLRIRRLSASPPERGNASALYGGQLATLVDGHMTIKHGAASDGQAELFYWDATGKTYRPALENRSDGTRACLVSAVWNKLLAGEDAELRVVGRKEGNLTLIAQLAVRAKGAPTSSTVRFTDSTRLMVIRFEYREAEADWGFDKDSNRDTVADDRTLVVGHRNKKSVVAVVSPPEVFSQVTITRIRDNGSVYSSPMKRPVEPITVPGVRPGKIVLKAVCGKIELARMSAQTVKWGIIAVKYFILRDTAGHAGVDVSAHLDRPVQWRRQCIVSWRKDGVTPTLTMNGNVGASLDIEGHREYQLFLNALSSSRAYMRAFKDPRVGALVVVAHDLEGYSALRLGQGKLILVSSKAILGLKTVEERQRLFSHELGHLAGIIHPDTKFANMHEDQEAPIYSWFGCPDFNYDGVKTIMYSTYARPNKIKYKQFLNGRAHLGL